MLVTNISQLELYIPTEGPQNADLYFSTGTIHTALLYMHVHVTAVSSLIG
jgi:hypothetical protein